MLSRVSEEALDLLFHRRHPETGRSVKSPLLSHKGYTVEPSSPTSGASAAHRSQLLRDANAVREAMTVDRTIRRHLISPFAGSLVMVWTHETWRWHTSMWRFLHTIVRWRLSTVLRRLAVPLLTLGAYTLGMRWVNSALLGGALSLPSVAITLPASSIGFLLVYRTNAATQRVNEARAAWGALSRHALDIMQLVACHADLADPDVEAAACALCRLLIAVFWILKAALREGEAAIPRGQGGALDAVRLLLPPDENFWLLGDAAAAHGGGKDGPAPALKRAVLRLRHLTGAMPLKHASGAAAETVVRQGILEAINGIHAALGANLRILTCPIPPTYQRHITRALILWLGAMPLALDNLGPFALAFSTLSIAYAFMGIDEIAIQIELPFAVMPLHEYCLSATTLAAEALTALQRAPPLPTALRPASTPDRPSSSSYRPRRSNSVTVT